MSNEKERDYRDRVLSIKIFNGVEFVEKPFKVRLQRELMTMDDCISDNEDLLLYAVVGCGRDVRGVVVREDGRTMQVALSSLEKIDVHTDPARNHLVDFSNGEPDCDGLNYVLASYNQITDLLENRLNARRVFQVKLRKADVMLMVIYEDKDTGKVFYDEVPYEWLWLTEEEWDKEKDSRSKKKLAELSHLEEVAHAVGDVVEGENRAEYRHYLELKAKYEPVRRCE